MNYNSISIILVYSTFQFYFYLMRFKIKIVRKRKIYGIQHGNQKKAKEIHKKRERIVEFKKHLRIATFCLNI